jgi:hypothetical protein
MEKVLIKISDKRKNILEVGIEILNITLNSLVFQTHIKLKLPLCLIKHHVVKAYGKLGGIAPRNLGTPH